MALERGVFAQRATVESTVDANPRGAKTHEHLTPGGGGYARNSLKLFHYSQKYLFQS